jgi:hypothetical protein
MVNKLNKNDMPTNLQRVYEYTSGSVPYAIYQPANYVFNAAPLSFCYLWIGASADTATFDQLWQNAGLYVFIPIAQENPDWAGIAGNLYKMFDQKKKLSLRFAWVDVLGENLSANINISSDKVRAATGFRCAQIELLYAGSSIITLIDDATAFTFAQDAFVFVPDTFDSEGIQIPLTSAVKLSLTDGLFSFSMAMDQNQLASCNAGLHYYYNHYSEEQKDPDSPVIGTYYNALNYPVLAPAAALNMQVSFDFTNPEDTARTKIEIPGDAAVPSLLATTSGNFLQLKPKNGDQHNGFGLVNYPQGIQETARLCFSLQGSFSVEMPGTSNGDLAAQQLLCGLSGTEHISFAPGDIIDFIPGQDAYAPGFPLPNVSVAGVCGTTSLLDKNELCKTSWMQVRKDSSKNQKQAPNYYYSQPQAAPLFYKLSATGDNKFLNLFNAEAGATFGGKDTDTPKCFPMVPYGGVANGDARATYSQFEHQVINPQRKQLIVSPADIKRRDARYKQLLQGKADLDPIAEHLTTTPQGLLVKVLEYADMQSWNELILAVNTEEKATLKVTQLNGTQQSAFQTSQQFLVVSKPDSLGKIGRGEAGVPGFLNLMSMAGWPFKINIGNNQYGDFSNVLIFKFCTGKLVDMVANSCSWTQSNDFVGRDNVGPLSRWLSDYMKRIDQLVKTEASYKNIYSLIHDPNWNGILALNVDTDVKNFPADLKGLLGGIDIARFKAHHFGIDINTIGSRDGHVAVPTRSSMFGLIDYVDNNDEQKAEDDEARLNDQDFDFKVLKLRVLFKNSKIIDFNSKISLTVHKLFGADVIVDGKVKPVLLDGTYENHNGKNTYIFNARENTLFNLSGKVLKTVNFEKVQFTTLINTDKDKADDIKSKFSVWGSMSFAQLPLDAFSFDKLSFGSLDIKMDFNTNDPTARTFGFDASTMTFDMLNSKLRDNSLAKNFPIALTELTISQDKKLPKDSNFLNVLSDLDANSVTFAAPWYGLSFNVNLGGAGALASQVGFTARLLVAWCGAGADAEEDTVPAGLFFQLPGAGKSEGIISLQSVLKLAVGGIRLYANKQTTANGDERIAYLLKLNKIVMDVFGKKLPPNGNTEFFLFGDPGTNGGPVSGSLGWYASYQKDKKQLTN